ncbi:transposable element Tcb2 transposase [Trichonephila clavipes]|nr:transposable element Tcb2 transposase [Trichonephila clavipes]
MLPHHRSEVQTPGWARLTQPSSLQWVDKLVPSLLGNLTLGVSRQTDHLSGTSANAPQGPRTRILSWAQPTRVSLLTARHTALLLTLARQHRHWTVHDQKHVAWYDESRFQLNRADGRVQVWRQPHKSMKPTCQQETVQAGGGSLMVWVWGVCSWRNMGPLIRLDTTLTSDWYVSILSDHLHSFMSIVHSDELVEFQQDNATPHTSRIATYWFQEHSSQFGHFRWPPKSSDINVIDYI